MAYFRIMEMIKPYYPEHKDKLLQILRGNIPKYFAPSEEQDFSNYLDHEREDYFVVEYNDLIVGCGGINYKHHEQVSIISWDVIDRNYQGKGLGGKLLSHRLSHIISHFPSYSIRVRTAQDVFRFYEKYGFELKSIQKDYWAPGYDLYDMEKINP